MAPTTITVRLNEALSKEVAANVGKNGVYDNVSEYIRDLIRRDRERQDRERFERLRMELQVAFSAPEDSYEELSADDIINRNRAGQNG